MQLNKSLSIILSLILCISAFIFPFMKAAEYSYAINDDVLWQPLNSENELVDAFQAYCKSRDLTIEGSIADAVTTATTGTFNGLCNKLGIDVTSLQADIKKSTDQAGNVQWLFNSNGITAYNRIFAQFLQDNELQVGDIVESDVIYSGRTFLDYNDRTVLVTITDTYNSSSAGSSNAFSINPGNIILGSAVSNNSGTLMDYNYYNSLLGSESGFVSISPYTVYTNAANTNSSQININPYVGSSDISVGITLASDSSYYLQAQGFLGIVYRPTAGTFYLAAISYNTATGKYATATKYKNPIYPKNGTTAPANVYITTNNTTINNNNYQGDTIINNYGVPSDPNQPDPDDPNYNPYPDGGGTTTGPNNTGGGSGADDTDVTFPDFDFQLPEIDWSLGDLSQKFPFSIPFDLVSFFTVLNATPEAPAIDAEIPLGNWYTWHFEADFSQFDNYAAIIRNVEFIAFCIGLIYLTIRLVKG